MARSARSAVAPHGRIEPRTRDSVYLCFIRAGGGGNTPREIARLCDLTVEKVLLRVEELEDAQLVVRCAEQYADASGHREDELWRCT